MGKKKAIKCKDAVNVDEILDMAKRTAENLNRWKKQGITTKAIAIDSLLTYCDKIDVLCKRIEELEKKLSDSQKAVQRLAPRNKEMEAALCGRLAKGDPKNI